MMIIMMIIIMIMIISYSSSNIITIIIISDSQLIRKNVKVDTLVNVWERLLKRHIKQCDVEGDYSLRC